MKLHHVLSLFIPAILTISAYSQDFPIIETFKLKKESSIRGISIPNPHCIWLSGSMGIIGLSLDSGHSFKVIELKDYNKFDFRDIHAFNDTVALILNAGSPGVILKTDDGGQNFREVYKNDSPHIFFNGFDFWDKQHGIAFGDPINNRLFIITTHDGGETWQEPDSIYIPECYAGEAGFAASGTAVFCSKKGKVIIGTGGSHARVFISNDFGVNWTVIESPMISGKESTGIFSVAMTNNGRIYLAGGDYKNDSLTIAGYFFTDDEGESWNSAQSLPSGYRSCLLNSSKELMVATGSNGTDISTDQGFVWKKVHSQGYHAAGTCNACDYIFFAGNNGQLGLMKIR